MAPRWLCQLSVRLISAQVIISRLLSSSPVASSALMAPRLPGILFLPLCVPLLLVVSLPLALSLKIEKLKKKLKNLFSNFTNRPLSVLFAAEQRALEHVSHYTCNCFLCSPVSSSCLLGQENIKTMIPVS